MKVLPGSVFRTIFRVSCFSYNKLVNSQPGFFFYSRRWWIDLEKIPVEIRNAVAHFAIESNRIHLEHIRRLRLHEKLRLMSLMVTIDEASQLTRIPRESFESAILMCQVKAISIGDKKFIPRTELERLLDCFIDDERIDRTCYLR